MLTPHKANESTIIPGVNSGVIGVADGVGVSVGVGEADPVGSVVALTGKGGWHFSQGKYPLSTASWASKNQTKFDSEIRWAALQE